MSVLHQVGVEMRDACLDVWPWLAPMVAMDTQLARLNWREILNRIAAGEDNNGIFAQPYVCVELGSTIETTDAPINSFAFDVPVMIGLITALKPVSTTVASTVGAGTTFAVADPSNIMPGIEMMVGTSVVEVASVSGSTVTLASAHGGFTSGATVKTMEVQGEISEALEKLRDALFQGSFNTFQVLRRPTVDASSMCEVNQVLMKTNYKAQGGVLKAVLHVAQTW